MFGNKPFNTKNAPIRNINKNLKNTPMLKIVAGKTSIKNNRLIVILNINFKNNTAAKSNKPEANILIKNMATSIFNYKPPIMWPWKIANKRHAIPKRIKSEKIIKSIRMSFSSFRIFNKLISLLYANKKPPSALFCRMAARPFTYTSRNS